MCSLEKKHLKISIIIIIIAYIYIKRIDTHFLDKVVSPTSEGGQIHLKPAAIW